jgi:hypothetical protein
MTHIEVMNRKPYGLPRLGRPVSPEIREAIAEHRRQQPKSPCYEQTPEEIENYYRHMPEGSPAAVRHTQGGMLRYDIADIEGRKPRSGRIYIRGHGAFYMKSGANCFAPTGQTSLVVPTEAVIAWANETLPWEASGYAVHPD